MSTWRNTEYIEHVPDSPNERWALAGTSMTRTFDLVDGSYLGRLQAAYDIYGYAVVLPTINNSYTPWYIHRVTPMPAPSHPATDILQAEDDDLPEGWVPPDFTGRLYANATSRTEPLGFCKGIDEQAAPFGSVASQYNRARLTVEFTTFPYPILSDSQLPTVTWNVPNEGDIVANLGVYKSRFVHRHIEEFSRLIKIPYGVMQTKNPYVPFAQPKLTKVGLPYREGGANVVYTWYRVPLEGGQAGVPPGVNLGRIGGMEGTINKDQFDAFAAETLLLDSVKTREYQGYFGEWLADVSFNMIYLPHPSTGHNAGLGGPAAGKLMGWNYLFDIQPSQIGVADYYPVTDSSGNPPFRTTDFSLLMCP